MVTYRLILSSGLLLALLDGASAQTRCEPTISNPCKPSPAQTTTIPVTPVPQMGNVQRRELPRLEESKVIPDIQFDRSTTFGVGQGGGILGIERKFDPKDR